MMLEIMRSIYANYLKFIEDQVYWYVFLFALIIIIGFGVAKEKKRFLMIAMGIFSVVYICPISARLLMYGMGSDVYWRMFWLVPIPIVISVALVLLDDRMPVNKVLRFFCMIAVLLLIGKIGKVMYQGDIFAKHDNMYNLPSEAIAVCDAVNEDADANGVTDKRLAASGDLVCYVRQYDASIRMPYGRDGLRGTYETELARQIYQLMETSGTDFTMLTTLLQQDGCNYLAYYSSEDVRQTLTSLGYRIVASTENHDVYAVPQDSNYDGWILMCYPDASGNQGEFFTLKNKKTGTFIVVDGGWAENTERVRQVIADNGNVVDAWFITHYHNDHVDAFNNIYHDPQGITIKKIYDSPLDAQVFEQVAQEWDTPDSFKTYVQQTKNDDRVEHLKRDQSLEIDGLRCDIFNAYDQVVYDTCQGDIPNDCSLVFKVSGAKDSILFCGDCHTAEMADMLISRYGENLQAEYVQPGHHGNNSFPTSFYDVVNPSAVIFNAPEWLMTGENYTAKDLKEYFEQKNVKVYDYSSPCLMFRFE